MLSYPLCVATRDPRIDKLESLLERVAKSKRWLARELKVSPTAVRYWFEQGTLPRDESLLDQAFGLINAEHQKKFSTPAEIPGKTQTPVYYTGNPKVDGVLGGLDISALLRSQEVEAWVINPLAEWAASAAMKRTFNVSAFPGAAGAGVVVQIEQGYESFRPGVVFFFLETAYPNENVILLLESQADSDMKRLGYVGSSGNVVTPEGEVSLKEWKVTHYAFAFGWGIGDQVTDVFSSRLGISPKGIRETYKS